MLEIEKALKKIRHLESDVRSHISTHRYQNVLVKESDSWNQICSSLDVIGDTLLAIESYTNVEFPQDTGVQYIFVYGILQSLFLQQDALRHLAEGFEFDYEERDLLRYIRETRNMSIGHPTNFRRKGETYYHHLSRFSLSKKGFKLLQYDSSNSTKSLNIDILSTIKKQLHAIIDNYSSIADKLKEIDELHKENFKENMLQDFFHSNMGYNFEKVSSGIGTQEEGIREWGLENLNMIKEVYQKFQNELNDRNEINNFIEHDLKEYFHALKKLEGFLSGKDNTITKSDARIYDYYIYHRNEHFITIAKEIDEEYKN